MGRLDDFKMAVGGVGLAVGALAAGGLAKAAGTAAEFESQLADLEKVTSAEMVGPLKEGLMGLSEQIPMSREGLTELAVQAGKFGADSEEEIMAFTESVGKIASATDLAADEAGTRFAKIADAVGVPMERIGGLGNAVNSLADSMKTDAGEITDTATRAGNVLGQQLGLGKDAVLGMSASMNEVSSSSRLAASSLKRAAETLMDPKKVEDMAGALGMSADEFRTMREEEPQKLMELVAEKMNEGGETATKLRGIMGKAANDFSKLGGQMDRTKEAQQTVNEQFEEGTSLNREMAIRTDTFSGKMQLLSNKVQNAATRIGDRLLPHLTTLLDYVIKGIDWFGSFNEKTDGLAGTFALVAGVIGGFGAAAAAAISALGGASAIIGGLATAFTVLTGPIGIAAVAIAGLAAIWSSNLFGIRDKTRAVISSLQAIFTKHFGPITDEIGELVQNIRGALLPIISKVQGFVQAHLPQIKAIAVGVFSTISGVVMQLVDNFMTMVRIVLNLINGDFSQAWTLAKEMVVGTVRGIWEWLTGTGLSLFKNAFTIIGDGLKAVFGAVMGWLFGGGGGGGIVQKTWNGITSWLASIGKDDIKAAFTAIGRGIRTVILGLVNGAKSIGALIGRAIGALVSYLQTDAKGDLKAAATAAFDAIGAAFGALLAALTPPDGAIVTLITDIGSFLINKGPGILKGAAEAAVGGIMAAFEGLYNGLIGKSLIPQMFWAIGRYIKTAAKGLLIGAINLVLRGIKRSFRNWMRWLTGARGFISSVMSDMRSDITDWIWNMRRAGRGLIKGVVNGIRDKIDDVRRAASNVASEIRKRLPGSDAEEGPLSDLTDAGEALPETFAAGIEHRLNAVGGLSEKLAAAAAPHPATVGAAEGVRERIVVERGGDEAIASRLDALLSEVRGGQRDITLEVDGKELARASDTSRDRFIVSREINQ